MVPVGVKDGLVWAGARGKAKGEVDALVIEEAELCTLVASSRLYKALQLIHYFSYVSGYHRYQWPQLQNRN